MGNLNTIKSNELPIPPHFSPAKVDKVWRVEYQFLFEEGRSWSRMHSLGKSGQDQSKTCLLLVDVQNTFCIPGFELFVAGRSGLGAVEDNRRLCSFIYRNLDQITQIYPTMDTHQAFQIFHSIFFEDETGKPPSPHTVILESDISEGRWKVSRGACEALGLDPGQAMKHLVNYTKQLSSTGKFALTVWPFHALLGGIGHCLVSAIEEAIFFHSVTRLSQPRFQIKGQEPLTEHYSVFRPEVSLDCSGEPLGRKDRSLIDNLNDFDRIIIAGQAKSHCVAWTVDDLLHDDQIGNLGLAERIYLLEDCTSPVVIPDVVDFTDTADSHFKRFQDAGMHVVKSTDPVSEWPS